MAPTLNIYTDGGSRGNPGPAAVGVVIKDQSNKVIHQFGQTIGKATNNVAEYQGVISALEWLIINKKKTETCPDLSRSNRDLIWINFFLDSTLVVNQLNGLWKVKDANLRELVIKVHQLEGTLKACITYTAIPREKNFEADGLLNQALDSHHS